ncbi:MAG: phage major capsid protein [Clostridia bacterium]|nr:phage major capsid protein [Clostridia bacterium]
MTILELREKRAKAWEGAKAFLDSHRGENGTLSAEDDATYEKMEQQISDLGREIARLERQEALDAELNQPVNKPLTDKPMAGGKAEKTGRASDEYKQNFWNTMRQKSVSHTILDALQIGTDSEGGFLVPDEYERTLVEALTEENIFRQLANTIQTTSGDRKIPVVAAKGTASWIDEEGAFVESDDAFSQVTLGAYKLGTMIKVSEELIADSAFDLEAYITKEFARRIGNKEEEAFFTGDGKGKPLGILAATGGAQTGVTAASATAITADEVIDLFYSLAAPYRKNAVWVLNDATVKLIRKLKDNSGQYLWQPSLTAGTPDTLLGRPIKTSAFMPTAAAGAKTIAFGDFGYYWIADRQGRSFKKLQELYPPNGQIGYLGSERVDGKLVLPEAIKVLAQKSA